MAKEQPVLDWRIAVFGESGAGKTVLLSRFYGLMSSLAREADARYSLIAVRKGVGNLLLRMYHRMEGGKFPEPTDRGSLYDFNMRLAEHPAAVAQLAWLDYPGKWWTQDPSPDEVEAAKDVFEQLLGSQVALLLVDGNKYKNDGPAYLRLVLDSFRQEVRRQREFAQSEGLALPSYPKSWVIALTKSDLFEEDYSAEQFSREVVTAAAVQLQELAEEVDAADLGGRFLLLSAAQADGGKVQNVHKTIGINLLVPLLMLDPVRTAAKQVRKEQADPMRGGAQRVLIGLRKIYELVDSLDDFLPPKWQVISKVLAAVSAEDLLDLGVEKLRKRSNELAKKGNHLEALTVLLLTEFKTAGSQRAYFDNQPDIA